MNPNNPNEIVQPINLIRPLSSEPNLADFCYEQLDEYLGGMPPEDRMTIERNLCLRLLRNLNRTKQVNFVTHALDQMTYEQHNSVNNHLYPLLKRDFISLLTGSGMIHIAVNILQNADSDTLLAAESVCREWYRIICKEMLWKKLIERNVRSYLLWHALSKRREWNQYLFRTKPGTLQKPHSYYRSLFPNIMNDINRIRHNWRNGNYVLTRIYCNSDTRGVYCLQYDDERIVAGLRDNSIKIWDRKTLQGTMVLTGHTGSVLCLQFDDKVIISGSSDSTVRIWDLHSGNVIDTLNQHTDAVLHLRFIKEIMVTCSKDRQIIIWNVPAPNKITVRNVLVGHRAAVNVIDFDHKYIISGSGDRAIKIWETTSAEYVRSIQGHERGIACLQYNDPLIITGSSDRTVRIFHVETTECIRVLEGHEDLVRCLRFDSTYIVSGSYDGKIKVWDLKAALDVKAPNESLCLTTLQEHTGKLFRLQFDQFQIVSGSHDNTIIIWDFLHYGQRGKITSSRTK